MSILEMSLQASAMIALIIIVRALGVNRLPKWGFQALWGIVVARLLVPVRVEFHLSVYNVARGIERALIPAAPLTAAPASVPSAAATASEPARAAILAAPVFHISPWLALWLAGAALLFLYFVLTHLHWRRTYAKARTFFVTKAGASRRSRRVFVKASNHIDAPLTYGVLRPVILVPEDLLKRPEYSCALSHELIHVRHWDALKKWLLMFALCVHWFNPLVWAMYILANRDIELYCDEALMRTLGNGQKARYATMLLDLEETRSIQTPLASHLGRNAIEERIGAIMKYRKTSVLGIALALALVVMTTAALATNSVSPASTADSAARGIQPSNTDSIDSLDWGSSGEDDWTVAPENYTADEIPVRALNAEDASETLYQYRVTPVRLNLAALADAYFGKDASKLPDIPSGDEDAVLRSADYSDALYRDAQKGTIQLRRPGTIPLEYRDFGDPVVDSFGEPAELPTPSPGEGRYSAQEAAGLVLEFLKDACGMDTRWLTLQAIDAESVVKAKSKAYQLTFAYMLDGRLLMGDPDAVGNCDITASVTDEGIMNLDGNLFQIEKVGPAPSGEPMTEEQVLSVATQGNHPPYGRGEVSYYLLSLSEGVAATRTAWALPMLDLEKGECFGYEFRDGRTGENLRGF